MHKYLENLGIKDLKQLNGFHNLIYWGRYKDESIIIRLSQRRTKAEIMAEINLLKDLAHIIDTNKPVKVQGHYMYERKPYCISFYQYLDMKAWYQTKLTPSIHYLAGVALGKMHLYFMGKDVKDRKSYKEHPDIHLLKEAPGYMQKSLSTLLRTIDSIKKKPGTYGLVHGDYLFSNLLYKDDQVAVIDFDDIEYNYFIYDIAVYMFYLLLGGDPNDINHEDNQAVFVSFMQGYRSINQKTCLDFEYMNLFFRLRQLKLYATIYHMPKDRWGPWQKSYMALTEKQVKDNQVFIDIDYQKLSKYI